MPELIDRAATLEKMCKMCYFHTNQNFVCRKCNVYELIAEQPTIEPEVRNGRWIPIEYDSYADGAPVWDKYECSECGHEHKGEEDTLTAFCPDCGADMREEGADNG